MTNRLTLELEPCPAGQFISVSRVKVRYQVNSVQIDGVSEAPDEVGRCHGWQEMEADGNYNRTNDFLNALQDARVGDQTLHECISYQGLSYWQFLPSYSWPFFFLATQLVELVHQVFEATQPSIVEVCQATDPSNNTVWLGVVCAVAEQYGVRVVVRTHPITDWRSAVGMLKMHLKYLGIGYFIRRLRRWILGVQYVLRRLLGVGNELAVKKGGVGRKLLCVTLGRRHWQRVPGDSSGRRHDEQFFPLFPAFREYGWSRFLFVDTQDVAQSELDARIRENDKDVEWRQFSSYLDFGLIGVVKAWLHFDKVWRKIKNDRNFLEDFKYKQVSLMPALATHLRFALHDSAMDCYDMLCIAGNILDKEKPAAAVVTYESGPWQRAVIVQSAVRGIPTLGLQHGMIFDNHYDYMHNRITTDPLNGNLGFTVPSVTCVWGAAWKKSLVEDGCYPETAIAVTGHWRYDDVVQIKAVSKTSVEARIGVTLGVKKVVAILTAGIQIIDYVKHCIQTLDQQGDIVPLIKLHPSDDPQPIKEWLKQSGLPVGLLYQGNLSDLLAVSDLVICQFSTTVSEAIIMDKRVILTNFTKIDFSDAYAKSGACLYVTEQDDLEKNINRALYDPAVQSELAAARATFVENYYHRLDGKSAQRVAATLESVMKDRVSRVKVAG